MAGKRLAESPSFGPRHLDGEEQARARLHDARAPRVVLASLRRERHRRRCPWRAPRAGTVPTRRRASPDRARARCEAARRSPTPSRAAAEPIGDRSFRSGPCTIFVMRSTCCSAACSSRAVCVSAISRSYARALRALDSICRTVSRAPMNETTANGPSATSANAIASFTRMLSRGKSLLTLIMRYGYGTGPMYADWRSKAESGSSVN